MFYKNEEKIETDIENSELFQCSNCYVAIHKFCYEQNENFIKSDTGKFKKKILNIKSFYFF